jgi:hypothetical protein
MASSGLSGQRDRSLATGGVERRSKRQRHGLQVQVASLASFGEDTWQQIV